MLWVPQIFPLNICLFFSSPSALIICQKIVVVFFGWFWVGIFCIRPFPLLLRLTSFQSMMLWLFFWCTSYLLLQVLSLGLWSLSSIHTHTGMSGCFEMTMHSVFFAFCWSPLFSLSTVTVVRIFCSFSSESTIKTLPSAYLRLFMLDLDFSYSDTFMVLSFP